jgi:methylthioribose-1-phosphate isomerase
MIPTLTWTPDGVSFIDQTKLPLEESYVLATTYQQVADVIVTMVVRGAPAIGVSAAYGVALGALNTKAATTEEFGPEFDTICARLASTRPTAVNLFWAIDRMKHLFANLQASGATLVTGSAKNPRRSPRHVLGRHRRLQNHGRIRRRVAA